MFMIIQERLAVETNSQLLTITAIFATDPSKPWSWSVRFDAAATKQISETRNATFAKKFERLTTRVGYAKQKVLPSRSL